MHECIVNAHDATQGFAQLRRDYHPQTDQLLLVWIRQQCPILALGLGRLTLAEVGLLIAA